LDHFAVSGDESPSSRAGRAILASDWLDLAERLDIVPRACRPCWAQTKGKVERMIREAS
jgi:transposase